MNLPENVTNFRSTSSTPLEAQRFEIAIRAEVILPQFWRDDDAHDGMRAIELEGWVDVLGGCSAAEIRAAWASYQRSGPRTASGRLAKPDAGALWRIVVAARPKPKPVAVKPQPEDQPRKPITPERAREIMREVYGDTEQGTSEPQNGALGLSARSALEDYGQIQKGSL